MASDYMTPDHPDAFKDHEKLPKQPWADQECLQCRGYGGWNLKLNQYMKHKPPICHFRASCSNCNGWGWTTICDHIHIWGNHKNIGRCLHEYHCTVCGERKVVDSSD